MGNGFTLFILTFIHIMIVFLISNSNIIVSVVIYVLFWKTQLEFGKLNQGMHEKLKSLYNDPKTSFKYLNSPYNRNSALKILRETQFL